MYELLRTENECIVEPPTKGYIGDSINTCSCFVLNFIERLSSLRGFQCIKAIGKVIFGNASDILMERFIIQCP